MIQYDRAQKALSQFRQHLWQQHKAWATKEMKEWRDFLKGMPEEVVKSLEDMTEAPGFRFDRDDDLPDIKATEMAFKGWSQIHEQKAQVRLIVF